MPEHKVKNFAGIFLFPAKALAAADSGGFIDAADFAGAGLPGFAEAPGKADVSDLGVIFLTYERAVHVTENGAGAEAKAIKVVVQELRRTSSRLRDRIRRLSSIVFFTPIFIE